MNLLKISKLVGAGVIAASLAVVPLTLPAHAQNNASGTSDQRSGNVDARGPISNNTNRDDNNDLGWFGLIGLAGLAGLAGKKRRETVHHTSSDPDVVRPGNDYR
jgi:LPXTG-motif cell wall-anchored protein